MAKVPKVFASGRMNKDLDKRFIPDGEYIDALNIRVVPSGEGQSGVVTNLPGTIQMTDLRYIDGTPLSGDAAHVGSVSWSEKGVIVWLVHDPGFVNSTTGKLDMIVSIDVNTNSVTYHIVSTDDGGGVNTILNFDLVSRVNGINIIDGLLFFTHHKNPPRKINLSQSYPYPVNYIDAINPDSLLVIKAPPAEPPAIQVAATGESNTYLEDRLLCFAYRYKYADGEHSATSPFSDPAYMPMPFDFDLASYLNEGMKNRVSFVQVSYNSGGPDVVGVDLLFKDAGGNMIKVIEKINKAEKGLQDNTVYGYTFRDAKVFTLLPEYEILRVFDNVPKSASAQTIIGNRLVYGDYKDGEDLVDANGDEVRMDYYVDLVSSELAGEEVGATISHGDYSIDTPITVPNSSVVMEFDGISLTKGAEIVFYLTYEHASSSSPMPTEAPITEIMFSLMLQNDYQTAYDLYLSSEFRDAMGLSNNIMPVIDACKGGSMSDIFYCSVPAASGALQKSSGGITAAGEPIGVYSHPTSFHFIQLQLPAVRYTGQGNNLLEYYRVVFFRAEVYKSGIAKSLHSNRGYEAAIVYSDRFNRSSTSLVSPNNTIHVPCSSSDKRNSLRVFIPPSQKPPFWADRFRVVLKPEKDHYETIFTWLYFRDPDTELTHFLLEGENAAKVETGDRLIVKADIGGVMDRCVEVTVLEKKAQMRNFIDIPSIGIPGAKLFIPSGVYMKIDARDFNATRDELASVDHGERSKSTHPGGGFGLVQSNNRAYPYVYYPLHVTNPVTGIKKNYPVPKGTKIEISLKTLREGTKGVLGQGSCDRRHYELGLSLVSSKDYNNFKDWFIGDGISGRINGGLSDSGGLTQVFSAGDLTGGAHPPVSMGIGYWKFALDSDGSYGLVVTATAECASSGLSGASKAASNISLHIRVIRGDLIVFETLPSDALPDTYYINGESYPVVGGFHTGNTQDQSSSQPAIIDSGFFNCYAFGNGVESYKIRDSVKGRNTVLGNHVTMVSEQEYKLASRFADYTWSGVYNDETNVNKLNEFNLGLLNFRKLDKELGAIRILDGRETDMLVLQEDGISYVLVGKHILSDAAGGGTITSIPEVFGPQVARVEKYGISHNPESYTRWGAHRFFTDARRGVVIMMVGGSAREDQLEVVSSIGMSTWFKDIFKSHFGTEKIGGYDPVNDAYILSVSDREIESRDMRIECGQRTVITVSESMAEVFYNLGLSVGGVIVTYTVISADGDFNIKAIYGGTEVASGATSVSGTISVNKNLPDESTLKIEVYPTGDAIIEVVVSCPEVSDVRIREVVVISDDVSERSFKRAVSYRTIEGYVSPEHKTTETLGVMRRNSLWPKISSYSSREGAAGSGSFPVPASTGILRVSGGMLRNNLLFDPSQHSAMFLESNVVYGNNLPDIASLMALSTDVPMTPDGGNTFSGEFHHVGGSEFLYIVWDLRSAHEVRLRYSPDLSMEELCLGEPEEVDVMVPSTNFRESSAVLALNKKDPAPDGFYSDGAIVRQQAEGQLLSGVPCVSAPESCQGMEQASGDGGVYLIGLDLGSETGIVVVRVQAQGHPVGLMALHGTRLITGVSTTTEGFIEGANPSQPVYIGLYSEDCGISDVSFTLEEFEHNGASFEGTQNTREVSIPAGNVVLHEGAACDIVMAVSRGARNPRTMDFVIISPCEAAEFTVHIDCPRDGAETDISGWAESAEVACTMEITSTAWRIPVAGSELVPGLGDYMYLDASGIDILPPGYYNTAAGVAHVNSHGIISSIESC